MSVSISRYFLCCVMVVILPLSVLGQTPSAILHAQGGAYVNGQEAKDASAIFSGDTVDTKPGFSATLALEGSSVDIQPESVTKFQTDFLELDHGGVAVGTSTSFKVKVNCITVTPVVNDRTQYEVTDVNGTVQVAARKNDVNVEIHKGIGKPSSETEQSKGGTVHEGEQRSYKESDVCGAPPPSPGTGSSPLNSKWIEIGGGVVAGGVLLCVLVLCPGSGHAPISPDQP
jgi:hypothetical protein